jgi:folylpolyglutamate synthase/dihydrofolate synthase
MAMFHTADEVKQWLLDKGKYTIKPGLERIGWMMEKLGHPERNLRAVHVGGTNGKGSTVAFLRSIFTAAGLETGTFTSPSFETIKDRICFDGKPISDEEFVAAANAIAPLAESLEKSPVGGATFFETLTAMAIYTFTRIHPVDVAIFEVGLGGRLDSTNVIIPLLSIITNVGHDHMHILGPTIEKVAEEKAGIIKNGVPVITCSTDERALSVFRTVAKEKRASLYEYGKQFRAIDLGPADLKECFTVETFLENFEYLQSPLLGAHQLANASGAVMAAILLKHFYSFPLERDHIVVGIAEARWPGRFEVLSLAPAVVIDGAHNPEGIRAFTDTLKRHFPDTDGTILFTAFKDKQTEPMIKMLEETGLELMITEMEGMRAAKAEDLYNQSGSPKKRLVKDWKHFLSNKIPEMNRKDALFVTGSLHFISEVKPYLVQLLFFSEKENDL